MTVPTIAPKLMALRPELPSVPTVVVGSAPAEATGLELVLADDVSFFCLLGSGMLHGQWYGSGNGLGWLMTDLCHTWIFVMSHMLGTLELRLRFG